MLSKMCVHVSFIFGCSFDNFLKAGPLKICIPQCRSCKNNKIDVLAKTCSRSARMHSTFFKSPFKIHPKCSPKSMQKTYQKISRSFNKFASPKGLQIHPKSLQKRFWRRLRAKLVPKTHPRRF